MSGWIRLGAVDVHLDARTMNAEVKRILGRKAESVTKSPDLRSIIGTLYVNQVTPYVPKKTGRLRQSGRGTSDGRVYWSTPYAEVQYYTQFNHYTTPGTGPFWTENVKPGTPEWDDFIARIAPHIIRRFKNE